VNARVSHLLGLDHSPSLCLSSGMSEALQRGLGLYAPDPGCSCPCRRCQRGACRHPDKAMWREDFEQRRPLR